VTNINNLEAIKKVLKEENVSLIELKKSFYNLREGLVKKAAVEEINSNLLTIEKIASHFKKVEGLRAQLISTLCLEENIQNKLESIINYFSKNDYEIALLFSELVKNLKELVGEVDLLSNIISFQSNLNNFIYQILNPESITSSKTYSQKGSRMNKDLTLKSWRG
jgi:phosphoserine phosphatase